MKRPPVLPATILACAVCALLTAGCFSPAGRVASDNTVRVSLVNSKTVEIGGRTLPVDQLAARLKRMGGNATTSVVIAVPQNTTNQDLAALTRQLRAAGFIRVIFTKPRHTDTNINTPARP